MWDVADVIKIKLNIDSACVLVDNLRPIILAVFYNTGFKLTHVNLYFLIELFRSLCSTAYTNVTDVIPRIIPDDD